MPIDVNLQPPPSLEDRRVTVLSRGTKMAAIAAVEVEPASGKRRETREDERRHLKKKKKTTATKSKMKASALLNSLLLIVATQTLVDIKPCDSSQLELVAHHEPLLMEPAEVAQASSPAAHSKRTSYACEEKELQIECQPGESIHLIRANYGRFSIQLCNENGQLDWKVNCMSPASSLQIIANR